MSTEPIYLDYAATTPVEPRVAARMAEVLAMRAGQSRPPIMPAAARRTH